MIKDSVSRNDPLYLYVPVKLHWWAYREFTKWWLLPACSWYVCVTQTPCWIQCI